MDTKAGCNPGKIGLRASQHRARREAALQLYLRDCTTMPRCVYETGSKVQRCELCSGGRGKQVRKGKCEFQYCKPQSGMKFARSKHFISYVYNGPPLKSDGWRQVATTKELHLGCTKLNFGNHNARNGPKYDTKYASLVQCKNACKDKVAGCDAINYSKDKGGKCQFQQCNGKMVRGRTKDYDSYMLESAKGTDVKTTVPVTTVLTPQPSGIMPGMTTPQAPGTMATTTTKPGLEVVDSIPAATTPAPFCPGLDIDCTGTCGGKTKTDTCGHCGRNGDGCTSWSKDDVSNKLNSVFPVNSTAAAVSAISKFLPLTKDVSRFKDITKAADKFTVYIRLVGYSEATFLQSDRKHLINFCNAMTGILKNMISVDSVTDTRRTSRRRLKVEIGASVDIAVTLDVSMVHPSVAASQSTNRTPVVISVVVIICCVALGLFVGVIVWYKINDRNSRRRKGGNTLEMEMTNFTPRRTDEYIQSSEPVLGSSNMREGLTRKSSKATVIVSTP